MKSFFCIAPSAKLPLLACSATSAEGPGSGTGGRQGAGGAATNGSCHLLNLANNSTSFVAPNGQKNASPCSGNGNYASRGTHDSVLNYDGGVRMAQNFAADNGCTWMTPTKVNGGAHVCGNLMGCMTGQPVQFCSFNADHTPDPDNGQSGNGWQYQVVWTFLSQL